MFYDIEEETPEVDRIIVSTSRVIQGFDMRTSRVGRTGNSLWLARHAQERRNLENNPDFESGGRLSAVSAIRGRRRPSHEVHVTMKSRINDTNVIQKPVIHKFN